MLVPEPPSNIEYQEDLFKASIVKLYLTKAQKILQTILNSLVSTNAKLQLSKHTW